MQLLVLLLLLHHAIGGGIGRVPYEKYHATSYADTHARKLDSISTLTAPFDARVVDLGDVVVTTWKTQDIPGTAIAEYKTMLRDLPDLLLHSRKTPAGVVKQETAPKLFGYWRSDEQLLFDGHRKSKNPYMAIKSALPSFLLLKDIQELTKKFLSDADAPRQPSGSTTSSPLSPANWRGIIYKRQQNPNEWKLHGYFVIMVPDPFLHALETDYPSYP